VRIADLRKNKQTLRGQISIQRHSIHQRYLLCLQDPADSYNDLGKKSFAIKDIQATFKSLHEYLDGVLKPGAEEKDDGDYSRYDGGMRVPILRRLVGRCDQVYDQNRTRLDLFGAELLDAKRREQGTR